MDMQVDFTLRNVLCMSRFKWQTSVHDISRINLTIVTAGL